ncbi:murein biosynthesis integral membrane protein MurJ [Coralliovum pocilloporae]|uniref:murein biosynthesis integral membrane protein MurJ n=1 Tax=Coralliovum pocilloporae TaxID=3066369 RepID=UPI003307478B
MSLIRHFATVGGATLSSRILGFVREVLIASLLGSGPVADAFYAAFRFPNLFRRLFAEGAFNTAFVPLFAKTLEGDGREAARDFARDILSFLLIILLGLTILAELAMPFVVDTIVAPYFDNEDGKRDLTILLTRIMFPYLLCMSLVAMLSGVLNTFRKFFAAALAPVLLNVVMIAVLLICLVFDTGNSSLTGQLMAWGVFAGGLLQLLMLVLALKRQGFLFAPRIPKPTPKVKRLLILAFPAAIAGGVTQINLLIGQIIASQQDGAISVLQYADRLYQLPLGVIGIAIGVVLLPELSRHLKADRQEAAIETENQSILFGMVLTVPAAIALAIIPTPLIAAVFQHGAFTSEDTALTARVLTAFAFGLPAFVLIKIFSPGYFAREDTATPMRFAAVSVAVNVVGSLALFPVFGPVGIAYATSVSGWVNAALLFAGLIKRGHWSFASGTLRQLGGVLLSAAIMGGLLWWGESTLSGLVTSTAILARISLMLALVTFGAVTYFVAIQLTGTLDLRQARRFLRRSEPRD